VKSVASILKAIRSENRQRTMGDCASVAPCRTSTRSAREPYASPPRPTPAHAVRVTRPQRARTGTTRPALTSCKIINIP